jgi:hypothetical protein
MITNDDLINKKFNKIKENFSKDLEIKELKTTHNLIEKLLSDNKKYLLNL